jgi:hypothetical protein|tara:strand:- start:139 stop:474 length:336 start_codon:yes stop_codon:yes gene_type:complete
MSWLDSAIEQANNPIDVDVEGIGLGIKSLQAKPLSAAEFQVLKSEPEIAKLSGEDRNELLGLRVVYEMLAKCDSELSWNKFRQLPLSTLGELATRVTEAVGSPTEGALGKS